MPQIYMGFMDEEVSDILNLLILKAKEEQKEVWVFDRGEPGGFKKELFERSIGDYGLEARQINATPISSIDEEIRKIKAKEKDFDKSLMYQRWYAYAHERQVKTEKKVCQVTIKPDQISRGEPLVLLRSPEMGLQPDMTRIYLLEVFSHLARKTKGLLEISCFGAGGAIASNLKPGDVTDVCGSFYVGVETEADPKKLAKMEEEFAMALMSIEKYVAKDALTGKSSVAKSKRYREELKKVEAKFQGVKFYAVVQLTFDATHKRSDVLDHHLSVLRRIDNQTYEIFRSKQHYKLEDAIKLAIIAFGSLCGKPKAHNFTEEKGKIKDTNSYRVPVKNTIATYYPKNSVNLTGSFFIGAEEKEAARNLLIGEANMEDYHVLRVLNFMRTQPERFKLGKQLITRIHCDPHEITANFADAFKKWAESATYTEDRFMAAIKWGLDGCRLNALTKDAHWDFVGEPPVSEGKKNFIYVCQKAPFKGRVLDPFFSEIASDFLKTVAAEGKPGKLDAFTSKQCKMKADLRRAVRAHARIVLKNPKEKHPRITRLIIRQMIDPGSYEGGIAKSPFDGGEGKIRIWVRPEKWKNKDSVLINEVEWTGENVDRALYKSTNQIVLQEKAETRV